MPYCILLTPSGVHKHSDKYAPRRFLGAQCAFKILMIHEVLQFVLRIAFRCVLHRCGSQDIHCWKLYCIFSKLSEKNSRKIAFMLVLSVSHSEYNSFLPDTRRKTQGTKVETFQPRTTKYVLGRSKIVVMILPQVHLRKPCYDFTFL